MKKFIPYLLFIIVFTFLFTNCDKENSIIEEPLTQNNERKVSFISKDEVQANVNLVKKLEEIKLKKFELKTKNDIDDISDFEIDFSKVSYIETEERHSYTFHIKRNTWSDRSFENLVLSSNGDDGYDAVIIKYESDFEKINPFTDDVDVSSLDFTRTPIDVDYEDVFTKNGSSECYSCTWTIETGVINSGHDNGDLDPENPDPIYGLI